MKLRKLSFILAGLFLLIGVFSYAKESAVQKTIVTVVEGKVMCFDIPEGISQGKFETGAFIERINDYSGKVKLFKGNEIVAYIPYNQRYTIYNQLQPNAPVLLQENFRRIYGTSRDIISVGSLTLAGDRFLKGEIQPADTKEVAELTKIADEIKLERKAEQEKTVEEEKGEVVKEVLQEAGVPAERGVVVPGVNNEEDTLGTGAGPVIDEQNEEEDARTVQTPPTEPTPEVSGGGGGGEGAAETEEYYWVDPANGDNASIGSRNHPWKTIQHALDNDNVPSGSTIYVAGNDSIESFPITINNKQNIKITSGDGEVTIDANNTAAVFEITNGSSGIELKKLRIYRGSRQYGGGIYVNNASITVTNCTIDSNSATSAGGGVSIQSTSTATFTNTTFSSNTVSGVSAYGGGLYKADSGNLTITGCTFSSNTVTGGSAARGGGIDLDTTSGTISISQSRFTSNNATTGGGAYGGGISINSITGSATITNCLFANNGGDGSNNVEGAGAWVSGCPALSPTFMNCTFANNLSTVAGAGANAAGLHVDTGTNGPTITNCVFYRNCGSNNAYNVSAESLIGAGNALIQYCVLINIPAGVDNLNIPTGSGVAGNTDPLFKGGSDYRLQSVAHGDPADSPCINAGTLTGAPDVDLNNNPRHISHPNPDMGCYEASAGDPPITGRVYDSVTGENISSPVVAIYRSGTTTALSTTTSNPYTFNVDPGNYYIAVSKEGYGFPSQVISQVVSGDHGDIFTASDSALTIDIPMDADGWLYIEKTQNKKRVSLGEIITYNIKIQNKNWYKAVENVELVDEIVNGFKYASGSTYRGSRKLDDPTISNHKAVFNIGTVSANSTMNISYQIRVGMGIPDGRYKAAANTRKSTTGARNSNISSVSIDVIEDPLFTRGTIIGKVFNDINKNGWQDEGEKGIPNVTIATEYGVVVETDKDGKYHIADVPAGNHLVKVDPRSVILSEAKDPVDTAYRFSTDNPYFVKITEGLLAKVNFGITQINTDKKTQINTDKTEKTSIIEDIKKFFIVALAEGTVRNLSTSGNIDMLEKDDRYDDGVHVDGKLALYLKGKVLGKYLITASLDTDRRPYGRYNTKELFKNLDPDKYYPVYGDASQVDYSGLNTQDVVYVMIEWDESFAKWGSYHTELPLYNRSMSGGIINYTSVGKTKFGDPWTQVKGFGAMSRQKPAHDEFVGTGGSLYYLRHQDVIMGSEKLRVEVRDRIGKTTINSIPLNEEKDYEIDYDTGRILLKKPLNSIQQAYGSSIISNDILMGERVYLVIDYEYYSESLSNEAFGGRVSQQIGHNIRVGGTYAQENREDTDDYQIYGGDTTVKLNKDTEINANYSHSKETQLGSTISYDGGLTHQEQYDTFSEGEKGDAYGIDGKTKLFNNTDIYLAYNKQDPYYSATDSISQQGSEKYMGNITSRLTQNLSVGVSHITQKYLEETTYTQTFADRNVHTTTGVLDYQKNKWDMRAEYQHQQVSHPESNYTYFGTIPLLDNDFIAGRIGYQLFQWLHPYIRGQGTVRGETNNQGTVGADVVIWEKTSLNLAETVGNKGNSTLVGLTSKVTEGTDVYANIEVGNDMQLGKFTKTTYGQSSILSPGSKAYAEEDYSSYRENIVRGNLLGYDKKITDTLGLGLTYERSDYKNMTNVINRDAGSIKLAYLNPDWLNANTKLEIRNDTGTNEVRQWVTENDILWRMTESISLTGRGNWGWSEDRNTKTNMAEFYELGTGFSLRPVTWDRLHILGKYSYLTNLPPDSQWDFIEEMESKRNVYAIEGAFDLFRYLQLVGKFAYRDLDEKVGPRDWTQSDTYLYIARTNFHIMNCEPDKPFLLSGWDLGVEYRVLANDQIEDKKKGFLVELDKDIGNYLRMGVGYNFTDYDDDLRNDDNYDAKGWFVRVNGKY